MVIDLHFLAKSNLVNKMIVAWTPDTTFSLRASCCHETSLSAAFRWIIFFSKRRIIVSKNPLQTETAHSRFKVCHWNDVLNIKSSFFSSLVAMMMKHCINIGIFRSSSGWNVFFPLCNHFEGQRETQFPADFLRWLHRKQKLTHQPAVVKLFYNTQRSCGVFCIEISNNFSGVILVEPPFGKCL